MNANQPDSGTALHSLATATEGIILVREDGCVTAATERAATQLGTTCKELVGKSLIRYVDTSWPPTTADDLASGRVGDPIHLSGAGHEDTNPVELVVHALDDGNVEYVVVVRAPEREDAARLRTVSERYRTIFEHCNDGILILDPADERIVECNPQACSLLGYTRNELLQLRPADIHPHEIERLEAFVETVLEEGANFTSELSCYTRNGRVVPAEISASVVGHGDQRQVLASIRDISQRHEREVELRRQSQAMETAMDGIAILSTDETFVYVNHAYARMYGYDTPSDLIGCSWQRLYGDEQVNRLEWEALPELREVGSWRGESIGTRTDDSTFPQELTISMLEGGQMVLVVRDVSDQKQRENRLRSLSNVSKRLMHAETDQDVAEQAVKAVTAILGVEAACVQYYDGTTNTLDRVATTDAADALLAERPAYDFEATYAGRAFRSGTTVRNTVSADDPYERGETESSLHLPLDAYGTLSIVAPRKTFTDHQIRTAEVFAGTVTAALERATRESTLQAKEAAVRTQRDELDTLNRVNVLVRDLLEALVEAKSRQTIEETVCKGLVASALYQQAWIGSVDEVDETLTPRAAAGERADLVLNRGAVDWNAVNGGLVAEALDAGTTRVHRQYVATGMGAEDIGIESGRLRAVAAVPLLSGKYPHGALVLSSSRAGVFGEQATAGLETLGGIVGYAIDALQRRDMLMTDAAVQLEFEIRGPTFFVQLSEELGCRCVYEGGTPFESGQVKHHVRIEGAMAADVLRLAAEADEVIECVLRHEHEHECHVTVVVDQSPPEVLVESGAVLRSIVAEDGVARLVAEAPHTADIRAIVDAIQSRYIDAELVAKRDRISQPRAAFRGDVAETLTSRQREIAEAVFEAGYYEWPREQTAEEIAESLGIASSTLHQHLRKAEQTLFAVFVGADDTSTADGS